MRIISSEFVRSQRKKCYCDSDVAYLKRQGFVEATRTPYFVYMVKPVRAYITVETKGGICIKQDMRDHILRYYSLQLLKLERFNMFLAEVYSGRISLAVTADGEIVIE